MTPPTLSGALAPPPVWVPRTPASFPVVSPEACPWWLHHQSEGKDSLRLCVIHFLVFLFSFERDKNYHWEVESPRPPATSEVPVEGQLPPGASPPALSSLTTALLRPISGFCHVSWRVLLRIYFLDPSVGVSYFLNLRPAPFTLPNVVSFSFVSHLDQKWGFTSFYSYLLTRVVLSVCSLLCSVYREMSSHHGLVFLIVFLDFPNLVFNLSTECFIQFLLTYLFPELFIYFYILFLSLKAY